MAPSETVMVTGASGFIASHMVPALLKHGYRVVGLDHSPCKILDPNTENFEFVQKEINDLDSLDGIDYVIHLAFETSIPECIEKPVDTSYNNLQLGIKMLQLAKEAGVKKFLYPSTASMYGNQPLPWQEDMPAYPFEPYSLQKYSMERFLRYYADNGLPTVIFRLFQVFGENQRQDQVLARFVQRKRAGEPIQVTQTESGSGMQSARRDFIYVGDIAEAFCMALKSDKVGKGDIINLASGYNYSIMEIAEIVTDNIESIPKRSFDLDEHLADVKKADELLGWKASTDIKAWLPDYLSSLSL